MANQPPTGQRFSHVYLKRGEPVQDGVRMRRRLAQLVLEIKDFDEFASVVPRELGVDVPFTMMVPDWRTFFKDCEPQDVLDVIAVAYRYLNKRLSTGTYEANAPKKWCAEVQRIFVEENVHYRVDEKGGVHFRFDGEFANNQAATIAALQGPRYGNVVAEFESVMSHLGKAPSDGKAAIRNTFSAAEGLFKLMFPNSPRLTAADTRRLEVVLQNALATDSVALRAAMKLLSSFKDWIDAAHVYRHEAGHEEPTQPPLTLTIQMVSLGATFIRWLAELDALRQPSASSN